MSFRNCSVMGWNVSSDDYHKQTAVRGAPEYPMSPSAIKEFWRCPQRWRNGYEHPGSEAKDWGNLVDCLLLTPDQFPKSYAVKPDTYPAPASHLKVKKGEIEEGSPLPWNGNAAYCDAWEKERDGLELVSFAHFNAANSAVAALHRDDKIVRFLEESDRQVLVEGEWVDGKTVIPVRCLIDLAPHKDSEYSESLGDLKTGRNASPMAFRKFAYQMDYHVQAAFDLDIWNAATGEQRFQWCFICQENYPPFQTAKAMFSQEFIELGRSQYRQALALYADCLRTGRWPGYDDNDEAKQTQGWSILVPDPWMESAGLFTPRPESVDETEAEESEMPS